MDARTDYDLNSIIQDATNLTHLLDAALEILCEIERDREGRCTEAMQLDRGESLVIIGRDMATRIVERTEASFARLSRPRIAA